MARCRARAARICCFDYTLCDIAPRRCRERALLYAARLRDAYADTRAALICAAPVMRAMRTQSAGRDPGAFMREPLIINRT